MMINIHLLNNNKSFYDAVSQSLKNYKANLSFSEGVEKAVDDIQRYSSHVVVINWVKTDFDIESLCKRIRRIKLPHYIYILIVAPREKNSDLSRVIDAGANDFVIRPFDRDELLTRMKIAERTIKLEDSMTKSKKKIIKLVKEDPVTNLYNRRSLMDEVLNEMGRASRETKYISALMASLLNFKGIAENHGMEIVDAVLAEIGRRLKSSCRPYDKIGRYGISDFLLFLPGARGDNAEKVASRIVKSIARKPFYMRGRKVDFSIAIGIAELDPSEISNSNKIDSHLVNDLILDALIKKSEMAVRRASKKGKNQIELF